MKKLTSYDITVMLSLFFITLLVASLVYGIITGEIDTKHLN